MTFKDLGIIEPILKSLQNKGYQTPTPIQQKSIPILLKGKDLLGVAQTGTGKTAAFAIPILHHIFQKKTQQPGRRVIKALVITPTRELAIQIGDSFSTYGKHTGVRNTVIFGGVKQGKQVAALRYGVDILIATPGRLLDLMNQGIISLRAIEYAVLDEADQMLDMGFIHDIKKIIAKLPSQRQSLFFSATMPKTIVELSRKLLGDFEQVTIKPQQTTAESVSQMLYYVAKKDKISLLTQLLEEYSQDSVLVFSRTKHGADKIVKKLGKVHIKAAAIHGNKSQNARQRALGAFKDGKLKILVATDIAARGIDVDELSKVINYDLPNIPETYVHRIGRTGRANASGVALSFCDIEERPYLRDIEKLIRREITVVSDHEFVDMTSESASQTKEPSHKKNNVSSGKNKYRRSKYRSGKTRNHNNPNTSRKKR